MSDETNTVVTTKPDSISFDGLLGFNFDQDGLLIVSIRNLQYVMMPEEIEELRNWLFAQGAEFANDL